MVGPDPRTDVMPVAEASDELGSDAAPRVIGMVVGGGAGALFLIFLGTYLPIPLERVLGAPGLGLAVGMGVFSFRRSWPWGVVAAGLGYAWTVFVLWTSAPSESGLAELARDLPATLVGVVHLTGVVLVGLLVGAGWRKGGDEARAGSAGSGAGGTEDAWAAEQARTARCTGCPHHSASRCGRRDAPEPAGARLPRSEE